MRVMLVYNQYRSRFGGEETVVRRIADLVDKNGGRSALVMRSSRGLEVSLSGKVRAFMSGLFNPRARREIADVIRRFEPDVIHVHNLYPLFSPWVLPVMKEAGCPVVMTVHNHFLTCPTADHLHGGQICEKCFEENEIHCVLQNCRGRLFESAAYALRSAVARRFRLYHDNISVVIALNEFARKRLVATGFARDRVVVIPNMVRLGGDVADASRGEFAMFAGRMCREKGVETLLNAVRSTPAIPVHLFGDGPTLAEHRDGAPPNAVFHGQAGADRIEAAYRNARFVVVPSRWFEGCPLVISEAMGHGVPVVASRLGGLPELVDHGATGVLFEPGDAAGLAVVMKELWSDPGRCRELGLAGRRKAEREFSETVFWSRTMKAYQLARSP